MWGSPEAVEEGSSAVVMELVEEVMEETEESEEQTGEGLVRHRGVDSAASASIIIRAEDGKMETGM